MKRLLSLFLLCTFVSCGPKIGYQNLNDDTVGYNEALNDSLDKQILLNIVRLRYRDTPTFLDVGIISAAYEFKRSATVGIETRSDTTPTFLSKPGFTIDYTEKPTTTYSPVRGKSYVEQALTPIRLDTLILLNSSGWKTMRIFRTTIQRINNIRNAPTASGPTPELEPEFDNFIEVANIFNELDRQDAFHIQKRKGPDGEPVYTLSIDKHKLRNYSLDRFWELLGLRRGLYEFSLARYSGVDPTDSEILIDTRSPLGILYFFSHAVEVPLIDEIEGRVTVTKEPDGTIFDWDELLGDIFEVHNIDAKCASRCDLHKFASTWVKYRGNIFYISDTDLNSKSTFSLLAQIMALQSGCPEVPVLTFPIGQ